MSGRRTSDAQENTQIYAFKNQGHGTVSGGIKASVTHFITPPTCQGVILKKRQTKVGFSVITGKNAENNHFYAVKKKVQSKEHQKWLSFISAL